MILYYLLICVRSLARPHHAHARDSLLILILILLVIQTRFFCFRFTSSYSSSSFSSVTWPRHSDSSPRCYSLKTYNMILLNVMRKN